jgi:phage terminase Nu1 subunit (DNA packaging protein)
MMSGNTVEREESEVVVRSPGSYRWWEDESRIILAYSKSEMAGCLRVSLKTIDTWIRQGAPVFEKGSNGRRYLLDAAAFVEWIRARRAGVTIAELRVADETRYREYLRAELERLGN